MFDQGDVELQHFLEDLKDDHIDLIRPNGSLGVGAGRKLLTQAISTRLTMFLDDDAYLTNSTIPSALRIFELNAKVGAVSMPHYDLQGSMIDTGGGVLRTLGIVPGHNPINFNADYVEIEDLNGSAFLCRTEVTKVFAWDERFVNGFEDTDASLQVYKGGRWKLAIVPNGKIVHDRSWLGGRPKYEKRRFNGLTTRNSYRLLRTKWKLGRADLHTRFLFEAVYPFLTTINVDWVVTSLLQRIIQKRKLRANRNLMPQS